MGSCASTKPPLPVEQTEDLGPIIPVPNQKQTRQQETKHTGNVKTNVPGSYESDDTSDSEDMTSLPEVTLHIPPFHFCINVKLFSRDASYTLILKDRTFKRQYISCSFRMKLDIDMSVNYATIW